ncbi:MAG: HAMP domain-containing protein [Oceanospirillaceae bacterium]|jgi:methyl-accepting chemotaxis protein|nr:HAMP domain-containing protein [Oceanospirillaceae bacterium]MBT4444218.1 HAMP domain-containing protein [Oceanospirillaceae bacterium]MBT6078564.1 HAMP domain-containing protein [Oceanospirillaceae bacterium]MBT7331198.1 HAMP domain-containing protein [Oceanospirillaceae bacterium]
MLKRFNNLSIRYKLMVAFLLMAGIPFWGICWWSINSAFDNSMQQTALQMESVRQIKKDQLTDYFATTQGNLANLSASANMLQGQDQTSTQAKHALAGQVDQYGYVDLLLVNPQGQLAYSVKGQLTAGANVTSEAMVNTGLSQAFRQALNTQQLAFADFSLLQANADASPNTVPMAFLAQPIVNQDSQVVMVGLLQLNSDGINAIMTKRYGMGEKGESYLVGPDHLMRSDSFLDPDHRSVAASFANPDTGTIKTTMVLSALAGNTDALEINENYTGIESYTGGSWGKTLGLKEKDIWTISAYTPIDAFGVQWALIAERDALDAAVMLMDLYFQMYWIGGIAALLLLLAAYYISRVFALPICYIAGQVGRIEKSSDFSMRLEYIPSDKDEAGQAAHAVNRLMDSLQAALSESNRVVGDVAKGQFDSRIEEEFKGDLLTLKQGINDSAASVQRTMHSLEQVMKAIANGNFGYRLDEIEMSGEFRNVMENTLNVMEDAIGEINQVMQAAAKGDFDLRVNTPLKGDLDRLKDGVNNSIATIATALAETVEVTEAMAQGDLTQRIDGDYQGSLNRLKEALNSSLVKMHQTVGSVLVASNSVVSTAGDISRGSEQLSDRTNQQSSSLKETSSSMEQMASTAQLNVDHAKLAGTLVASGKKDATGGVAVVQRAVAAMSEIDQASQQIASIVDLIDGIAFQTNLLALNAAVEAARAGEHGRGFAVVAGEVRILAQKAAESANEIKVLIEDSTGKVREGSQLVDQTGEALNSIAESISKVNDIVLKIATAAGGQSSVINQVNSAVAQLEHVNQLNASLVQESSAASYSLNDQTQELITTMRFFKVQENE